MRPLALALALALVACADKPLPPVAPAPPPAPSVAPGVAPDADPAPVSEGDVTTATVAGVAVIVQRIPGAAFAAGNLYIRGGTRNWTATNAGIEDVALKVAASGGTASLEKAAFARRLAALGASLDSDARNDFGALRIKAPREAWDDAFALLVDALSHPALPASEIELVRTQLLAQLHHEQEDPDGQLWTLERGQIFAGHPYQNRSTGTVESVTALKAEDLAAHLEKLRETSRFVFVATGDLDPAHVFAKVKATLGTLRPGRYVDTPLGPLAWGAPGLVTQKRAIPTNYIQAAFHAPRWNEPDRVAGLVAAQALSWRLWQEVRTKRNLTYSVNAYINDAFVHPFGVLYVTATDPNATMRVMLDEVKRLKDEPIGDKELAGYKSVFLTGYHEGHETPDGIAGALGDAQLYGGDWRIARALPEELRAVTAKDIQAFAQKHMVRLQAAVVGDPAKVDAKLFTSF
jgi:zinc protease